MGQEVVSSYLRSKLSSILEEAEADSGSPSHIISRFRSIQSQIESTEASLIPVDLLYDLIEALSECRVFAYQRRTPHVSKKGFNLNKLYHPLSEFMFRRRIRKRLDTIDENLRAPSPGDSQPPAKLHILPTHPIPDTSLIIGLDAEAETIEAWLMATASSDEEGGDALRAVGIVGRCGCGKTALAQKVFASPKVVEEFLPRIWVCLSNMLFDNDPRVGIVNYILGEIVKAEDPDCSLVKLLEMLEQRVMGKRYLIVLDDAWRLPGDPHFLSQGLPKGRGGAVIVTSRRKDVISQMVGDEHVIRLQPDLSGEICWRILSTDIQQQGKMEDIRPKLSTIKADVKRNFDGLPLVAKSFATVLPDLLESEFQMNHFIVINHGGRWNKTNYEDGDQVLIPNPPHEISLSWLKTRIEIIAGFHKNPQEYSLYGLADFPDGGTMKVHIMDEGDLRCLIAQSKSLRVFVTITEKTTPTPSVQNNFVNLLNAQGLPYTSTPIYPHTYPPLDEQRHTDRPDFPSLRQHNPFLIPTSTENENEIYMDKHNDDWEHGDDDDDDDDGGDDDCADSCGGSSGGDDDDLEDHDSDTEDDCHRENRDVGSDDDVEDDAWQEERTTKGQQWVIRGAQYQASIPCEPIEVVEATRDTLCVGATFISKESMRMTLGLYHLHGRVEYEVDRSDKRRFVAVCKNKKECQFLMIATAKGSVWRISKWVAPHSCHADFTRRGPRTASANVIAAYFAPSLMIDGAVLRPKDMQAQLEREFGVAVSYGLALEVRNQAITMIYGEKDKSFSLLPSYLYMVQQSNVGSVVNLQTDTEDRFQYAYMALRASIDGFLTCGRPVIVVDGTHLKGKYKCIMFVAATKDANEQIFPLAFGIGDKENDNSWTWFLRQLKRTFGSPDNLLFVSDQHMSIKNALDTVYPETPHGICIYHLQKKIKQWGKHVVGMFQNAAYAYRSREFDTHMNNISGVCDGAYKKLMDADPRRWARSKCEVRRYRFLTSNCAESLNGRLRWARKLPVCTLLECVRGLVGSWFIERRTKALCRTDMLTEFASKKLEKSVEHGLTMSVEAVSGTKFKVTSSTKHYLVDLTMRKCTCQEFQFDLIPCSHASAAIRKANQSLHSYVSKYYLTETLVKMYAGEVECILHPDEWDIPLEVRSKTVLAPINPRQAGRPRTSRISSESSRQSRPKKCSRCGKIGHYSARCT